MQFFETRCNFAGVPLRERAGICLRYLANSVHRSRSYRSPCGRRRVDVSPCVACKSIADMQ